MFVFRPVTEKDEARFIALALETPSALTSMPKDIFLIKEKLKKSLLSFASNTTSVDEGQYLFVLEETETKELIGMSALYTNIGSYSPIYYYQLLDEKREKLPASLAEFSVPQQILQVVPAGKGATEIGTLYLKHEYRKEGLGPLLSLSRFLFAATFPHLFADNIHANMRGVFDEKGIPPFWEFFGSHFFDVDYNTVIDLIQHDKTLAVHLLPPLPLYHSLIAPEARAVMGKTHTNTIPAIKMLNSEGFEWNHHIDPFDAGPLISCETKKIRTVADSRVGTVVELSKNKINAAPYLVATQDSPFRVCYAGIEKLPNDELTIDTLTADCLQLTIGQRLRFIALKSGDLS